MRSCPVCCPVEIVVDTIMWKSGCPFLLLSLIFPFPRLLNSKWFVKHNNGGIVSPNGSDGRADHAPSAQVASPSNRGPSLHHWLPSRLHLLGNLDRSNCFQALVCTNQWISPSRAGVVWAVLAERCCWLSQAARDAKAAARGEQHRLRPALVVP